MRTAGRASTALIAAAMLLVGCAAPASGPTGTVADVGTTAAAPDAETATTTPAPERGPITIPGCDEMNPVAAELSAEAHQRIGDAGGELMPAGPIDLSRFEKWAGPSALTAMAAAEQVAGCIYPLHYEGAVLHWTAELPTADQRPLIDALRADPDIHERPIGDALTFNYAATPDGVHSNTNTTYLFVDDFWITVVDGIPPLGATTANVEPILAALRAENPWFDATTLPPGADPACLAITAPAALADAVPQLEPYELGTGSTHAWLVDHESVVNPAFRSFDPCADLTAIVTTVEGATVSSPAAVLLFHRGEYLGTATDEHYGFWPGVLQPSTGEVRVTYHWPKPGESNAEASGRSESVFSWDAATGSVVRTGELPPVP